MKISSYTGFKVVDAMDDMVPALYTDMKTNHFDLLENQYLMIQEHGQIVDYLKWQDGEHRKINKSPVKSLALETVRPKNPEQRLAIDALLDKATTVKLLTGTFGAGKDFLMAACAFQMISEGRFEKIVWLRNNVEVRDSNPIGYLKGDFEEKMGVWAMPLADHIGGKEALDMYIQKGTVEIQHLGFIRGRDIKNSIIICSEAEHLTRKHVQLILGRVSEGSILFINGDWRQIDAKVFEEDNGLTAAIERLKGNKLFSYVHLSENVRSDTAKLADLLD